MHRINRRAFLAAASFAAVTTPSLGSPPAEGLSAWEAWKAAFLRDDGRVVDDLQGQASHSEGQAYGMILAESFSDETAFRMMDAWAQSRLCIRDDALMAWRWFPDRDPAVPEWNTASDGDLFRAWALVRGASTFQDPEMIEQAKMIANDLFWICVAPDPRDQRRLILTPGAEGFRKDGSIIVNPSYYMPRALREIAQATGMSPLAQLAADGEALLEDLSRERTVPDWVSVSRDGVTAAPPLSWNSGYEAMRVPLFLIWSGLSGHPAVRAASLSYSRMDGLSQGHVQTVTGHGGELLEESLSPGYGALRDLTLCATGLSSGLAEFSGGQPYYPATLHLLAQIAARESGHGCVV